VPAFISISIRERLWKQRDDRYELFGSGNYNFMNKSELVKENLNSFWNQVLSVDANYHFHDDCDVQYTVTDINDPLFNAILSSSLSDNKIDLAIQSKISFYKEKGLSFCWWVDSSSDSRALEKILEQKDFTLFGDVSGMILKTPVESISESNNIQVDVVSNVEQLRSWIYPIQSSFHMSEISAQKYLRIFKFLNESENPPIHYTASIDNKIVASSTLFKGSHSAGIYNCATLENFRNKGILSALVEKMINDTIAMNYEYTTLQASPMSVHIFKKFGFKDIVPYKLYLMGTE